jgi:nitrogen fixation NifU-like protein
VSIFAVVTDEAQRPGPGPEGIDELYRSRVMAHARAPRNFGALAEATHRAEGHNPLCGDQVTVMLRCAEQRIVEARFEGAGCALSMGSASMLTEALAGRTLADAEALRGEVMAMLAGDAGSEARAALGELSALSAVSAFPARLRCVTLAWETLGDALRAQNAPR